MSYHEFPNLRELFSSDLTSKMIEGVSSAEFEPEDCNCNSSSFVDGKCAYGGKYRHKCVIYEAKCKYCGKAYIGNTQQKLKIRMGQHYSDVRALVNTGKLSDSFAAHFASHFKKKECTAAKVRKMVEMRVLFEGNPISCSKSFGKLTCSLCMAKRMEILERF